MRCAVPDPLAQIVLGKGAVHALLAAALAFTLLVPAAAHAQCDPGGNRRPVRFISADRYAEKALSAAELDQLGEGHGALDDVEGPWRWWSDAKIQAHCAKKDVRMGMSVAACVVYSQHQNGMSALIDVAQEMATVRERVDEKRAACPVPPAGTLTGAKARAFWKCLGGIQLPPAFSMTIAIAGDNVQRIAVTGTFLRGTPQFAIQAHVAGQGCGHSGWTIEQTKPLDWPTSNSGEITLGDVTWAP